MSVQVEVPSEEFVDVSLLKVDGQNQNGIRARLDSQKFLRIVEAGEREILQRFIQLL